MVPPLSPEFRLAAACAIWPPSDYRIQAIQAVTAGPLDWSRFLRVARRHRLIGLVHDGLTRSRTDMPPPIAQEIRAQAASQVRQNLAMAAEALRLQRLFDDAELPVLFVKGASLAVLAFGNVGLRGSQDIDLLVPSDTLPEATALIERAGYRRFEPPSNISDAQLRVLMPLRKDLGFIHRTSGLEVELHWRLFLDPHTMVETSVMTASRIVPLSGINGLRTLGTEDLFAYLCMHGALHCWNRLQWLADINALVATAREGSLDHLLRTAEARRAGRAAAQGLLLCKRLLGTPVPTPLLATVRKSAIVRWLESTAFKAITTGQGEQHPHDARFGTTRGTLSTFLLGEGWRYRFAELNLHMTNQTDILTVPLPASLRFLYPVLRLPLWAWRHAIKRAERGD